MRIKDHYIYKMFLSKYLLPVTKDIFIRASNSFELMLKSGLILQQSSGLYYWLPMGLKVLQKLQNLIRYYMSNAGFIEILMPCLQNKDLWLESGRYKYDMNIFNVLSKNRHLFFLGPTSEELVTDIVRNTVKSYKDLPKVLYQIHWKFRDELRPRGGVLRSKEFLMFDAYSFDINNIKGINTYNKFFLIYLKIFNLLGLKVIPVLADNGNIGGNLSHEFHVISDVGDSLLYYDNRLDLLSMNDYINNVEHLQSFYAVSHERFNLSDMKVNYIVEKKSIEIGHIFYFGDRYSQCMHAKVNTEQNNVSALCMGSYGIGISRLVSVLVEVYHDNDGIVWPKLLSPFQISIINLNIYNHSCHLICLKIYDLLVKSNIEVLYDDTDKSIGEKFKLHNLIGFPLQIIVGKQYLINQKLELKERKTQVLYCLSLTACVKKIFNYFNL